MVKHKKHKGGSGPGGRRPRRQRTPVQHYTDDNPCTFTKKKKRRRGSDDSGSSESDSDNNNNNNNNNNDDYSSSHQQEQQQQQQNHRHDRSSDFSSDDFLNAVSAKKRKRPKAQPTAANNNNNNNNMKNTPATPSSPSKKQELAPPPPPPQNVMLTHTSSVAPILPLATTCPLARHSLAQQYPVVFGRGLGIPRPPEPPEWTLVSQYEFFFPEDYKTVSVPPTMAAVAEDLDLDYDSGNGGGGNTTTSCTTKSTRPAPVLKTGPWPVCRVITSVCCSLGQPEYLAVGDSAGFVVLFTTFPKGVRALTRLDTTASRREHKRQRDIQAKVEHQCRHKPELLENRSPFWATAKTPNAIQTMTWVAAGSLLIVLTPYEVEALKLSFSNSNKHFFDTTHKNSSNYNINNNVDATSSLGTSQNCQILWTLPVAPVYGPRKNGSNALLTGGEYAGSHLELQHSYHHYHHHHQGNTTKKNNTMMLWNTWGVAPVNQNKKKDSSNLKNDTTIRGDIPETTTTTTTAHNNNNINNNNNDEQDQQENNNNNTNDERQQDIDPNCDWPLLLMRNPHDENPAQFVKIIPFQRQEEEEEAPPPVPVKRSPGRPPKKKPKPKVPVKDTELVWTQHSKCHAASWDNHNHHHHHHHHHHHQSNNTNETRLIIVYSATSTMAASEAQVQLALLVLTDDISEHGQEAVTASASAAALNSTLSLSSTAMKARPQFARLIKQVSIPVIASVRNVANVPEVTLQQSPKGTYTLVAGSRGVRMYQTETMALLRVYGEHVSLHGKTMVWKSCFVMDNRLQQQLYQQQQEQYDPAGRQTNNDSNDDAGSGEEIEKEKTVLRQNRQGFVWIEQEDALASLINDDDHKSSSSLPHAGMVTRRRNSLSSEPRSSLSFDDDNDSQDDEAYWLHQAWIVGIPHPFRGPKELQETLYFWQGAENLPLFTLPLPQESGGVQSIHPLVTAASSRNNGMWQRLMVATVHGECFEMSPSMRSDFPGNMYNPGYSVIQDNVEYIEDEDELDKVMIDVPDEEDEESEDEEILAPPIGSRVGGEIVDPELAEAIRRSLLESKGKSKAHNDAADDDDDESDSITVVVKDPLDDDESEMVIPCEPEPFLRKKVLPDLESEAMMDLVDATDLDKSAKDAEFASEVLSILPQARFAQAKWDKQKVKIKAVESNPQQELPQQQVPHSAVPGDASAANRFGKGKRSRAGNLEALLKSSIDAELRQYMTDRDRLWADGSGSKLQEDGWDDVDGSAAPAAPVSGFVPAVSIQTPVEPSTTVDAGHQQGPQTNGNIEVSKISDSSVATSLPCAEAGNKDVPASSLSVLVPDEAKKDDLKLVAIGLLNLSPVNTPRKAGEDKPSFASLELSISSASNNGNKSATAASIAAAMGESLKNGVNNNIHTGGVQIAVIELKEYSGVEQQYSCTGTVAIPLTLDECNLQSEDLDMDEGSDAAGEPPQEKENGLVIDAQPPVDGAGEARTEAAENKENHATVGDSDNLKRHRCAACQGRMVIHSCGKRDMPIDFEALARAEKEKQEREEEEKRQKQKEKRKELEIKRREAKKKKKEEEKRKKEERKKEEERKRKEEEAELRRIREAKVAEARARMANIGDCLESVANESNHDRTSGTVESSFEENKRKQIANEPKESQAKENAVPVHGAIADAWREHAEKFTLNSSTAVEKMDAMVHNNNIIINNNWLSNGANTNALEALASMAEAATPQTEIRSLNPAAEGGQTHVHVREVPVCVGPVGTAALNRAEADSTAEHRRVVHGFFSLQDAYPQHAQSGAIASQVSSVDSAARMARRDEILNSFREMELGAARAAVVGVTRQRIVDLSSQGHPGFGSVHTGRAHSFQVHPVSHSTPSQPRVDIGQHGPFQIAQQSASSNDTNVAARSNRPYFGYTQISTNFKPKLSLKYDSPAMYTTNQSQPLQHQSVATRVVATKASDSTSVAHRGHSSHGFHSGVQPSSPVQITRPTAPAPTVTAATAIPQSATINNLLQPMLHPNASVTPTWMTRPQGVAPTAAAQGNGAVQNLLGGHPSTGDTTGNR